MARLLTGGHGSEETIAKRSEVSDRVKERQRSDPGYPRVTVENAAKFVAQNTARADVGPDISNRDNLSKRHAIS